MPSTYIDCFQYQQQPIGFPVVAYVGNMFRFAEAQPIGNTLTLSAGSIETGLDPYTSLYIFDGPQSEIVQVLSETTIGATTLALTQSTLYVHSAGVAVCTDGDGGSLGQQIFVASQWIEDICHQSLWESLYTGEILTLPTMRAAFDNQNNLHFRPRHFPVTSVTGIALRTSNASIMTLDPSQGIVDADQQTVDMPCLTVLGSPLPQTSQHGFPFNSWLSRQRTCWVTIEYTAGYPPGKLPWTIIKACTLFTSDMFIQLSNPVGATSITQGKRSVTFSLRGDIDGQSLLYKEALSLLAPYIAETF